MTVTKISTSVFAICFQVLVCTKFHCHPLAEDEVIGSQNFQVFSF